MLNSLRIAVCRMWEFSVGLYMINIWPDSLLYAAIYGAVESASTAVFGPIIGRWVNRLSYVQVSPSIVISTFYAKISTSISSPV